MARLTIDDLEEDGTYWACYKDNPDPTLVLIRELPSGTKVVMELCDFYGDWGDWSEELFKWSFLCKLEKPNPMDY